MCFNWSHAVRKRGQGAVIFWFSPLGDTRQGGFRAKRETTPQALRCDRGADPALKGPNPTEVAKISR